MDKDILGWVMEFLLRNTQSDQMLNKVLTKIPLVSFNHRLKKSALLRAIQTEISDGSVSETILEHLQAIHDLDKNERIQITSSMKAAYCAVAVECTMKYEGGSVDYFEAVKRIWKGKIENLGESELVTEELGNWKQGIEAAIWGGEKWSKLLEKKNTSRDAFRLVRAYLGEAWAIVGPSLLELTASKLSQLIQEEPELAEQLVTEKVSVCDNVTESAVPLAKANQLNHQDSGGGEFAACDDVEERTFVAKQRGIENNVLLKQKHIACRRRARGPARITDSEDTDTSCSKYNTVPTLVVNESGILELQAIVTDPLPEASRQADSVICDMTRKTQKPCVENHNTIDIDVVNHKPCLRSQSVIDIDALNHKPLVEKQNGVDKDVSNPSFSASTKPSLMTRNSTAHTYEWDDSIDSSPGGPSNRSTHSPSPTKRVMPPLKKHEMTKFTRRRSIKRWSPQEEEALRNGVHKYGKRWKTILLSNPEAFAERTDVDLKDKWRNMTKQ